MPTSWTSDVKNASQAIFFHDYYLSVSYIYINDYIYPCSAGGHICGGSCNCTGGKRQGGECPGDDMPLFRIVCSIHLYQLY